MGQAPETEDDLRAAGIFHPAITFFFAVRMSTKPQTLILPPIVTLTHQKYRAVGVGPSGNQLLTIITSKKSRPTRLDQLGAVTLNLQFTRWGVTKSQEAFNSMGLCEKLLVPL